MVTVGGSISRNAGRTSLIASAMRTVLLPGWR